MKFVESETLELKKSTSEINEAIVAIVAILNKHKKGLVYFGVSNSGLVVGQNISEKTLRDVSRAISEGIEPKIYPFVKEEKFCEKKYIAVEFFGTEGPYLAFGRPYIRVGNENKQLSAKEYEKIIIKKNEGQNPWDKQFCDEAKLLDLSSVKVKNYLKKYNLPYLTTQNSLKKLGLIKNNKLINSAILFFGKKPERFFSNAKLRCAVFATNDTLVSVDMQEFEGDIFFLIKKAQEYFIKNINVGMKLDGLERIDVPEIDKSAFREAVINAFCHRDYINSDSVHLAIFKDRVEIRSPGLLYGDLTINEIKKGNISERRNELVADLLHKIHLIEKWGKGIKLILSKEPKTEFFEIGNKFYTVFKRKNLQLTPLVTPLVTPPAGLTELEAKIFQELVNNPKISRNDLSKKLNVKLDTVKEYINKLKAKGILARKGTTNKGYWEVKKLL
jgi:ATP-dependent DNA helicase RecG